LGQLLQKSGVVVVDKPLKTTSTSPHEKSSTMVWKDLIKELVTQ